jgi:hypothetical protein
MTIEAELTDTNVPVKLVVTGSAGGIAGLTVGLEVLDGETQDSYLDFADGIFKTIGWTTKSVNVTDVGGGRYSLNSGLNVAAMVSPSHKLVLEYNVSGSKNTIASEELLIRESTYQAKVGLFDDNIGVADRYTVVFYKNSEPVTAGITVPTIQVIKASDGLDLIATVALTQVGALGIYKHDEAINRIVNGASYYTKVTATIDGKTRTWYQQVGRDS